MTQIDHFIPGRQGKRGIPLESYLQLMPANVVARYVAQYTNRGELLLNPLAQTGTSLLEAVAQGRTAIASSFNPINTLLVRGLLTLPSPEEIDAATVRLGDSLKRDVPLRDHINQLYASACHRCLEPVTVEYFLWYGDDHRPAEKYYRCPQCAGEGQYPVQERDLEALDSIERHGVHYWYLLERLASRHEPERGLAEELLDLYTARNLYALTDLSMKIETLFADSPLRTALQLMLLRCLDTCSKLDPASPPRPTALRLQPPSRFVERNVWHAFEESYRQVRRLSLRSPPAPQPLLDHLDSEDLTHAAVVNQPVRTVAATLPPASVSLVLLSPPPYYRPFWTLSYLWSGWLWGRDKAALFKPLLRRKLMGWSWYRRSLSAAVRTLHRALRPKGRVVLLLDEVTLTHISNLILAAVGAAFKLERILYQPEDIHPASEPMRAPEGSYRLAFTSDQHSTEESEEPSVPQLAATLQKRALNATIELLRERGEALHFGWLHSAIYRRWGRDGLLRQTLRLHKKVSVDEFLQEQMEGALEEGLTTGTLELLPTSPEPEEQPSLWWLHGKGYPARPLGDRVERAVSEALRAERDMAYQPLEDSIHPLFPGPFTPGPGLVDACLRSYAVQEEASGHYHLRPEEEETYRQEETDQALTLLVELGHRLEYDVSLGGDDGHRPGERLRDILSRLRLDQRSPLPKTMDVAWEEKGKARHLFAFHQTTILADLLRDNSPVWRQGTRYIVIPDRRLDLLRYRIAAELLLRRALDEGGWSFIKLKPLQTLCSKEQVVRQDLTQIVGLEPLIESPEAQLPLF